MLYLEDGVWVIHSFKATYVDSSSGEEVAKEEFTSNREELEKRVSQWAHFYRLAIEEVRIDGLQQQRLETINAMGLDIDYRTEVTNYIRYGYINPGSYANTDFANLASLPVVMANRKSYQIQVMKDKIALKRWLLECSGLNISGMSFGTSDREKALVNGKVTAAMIDPQPEYNFKVYEGWVKLNAQQVKDVGMAIDGFIQGCFDREGELSAEVTASDNPFSVDITQGWPSNQVTI